MKNKTVFILVLLGFMTLLVAGCVGSQAQPAPAATTGIVETAAITIVPTETTREIIYHTLVKTIVPTTTPKTTPEWVCKREGDGPEICLPANQADAEVTSATEISGGPMNAPVTLDGLGNQIVWFDTINPGVVNFKMRYSSGLGEVKNCEEKKFEVLLAGKSIDTKLYSGGSGSNQNPIRTFNLLYPGRYSLSVKGCWGWTIIVS